MPKDDQVEEPSEIEEPKQFKAVTEELTTSQPTAAPAEEVKPFPSVVETQNITLEHPKAHESGIFLKFFLVTFLATLLALALAGGIYVYLTGTNISTKSQSNSNNTPTP